MKIFRTVAEVRNWRHDFHSVGFVPTMGALHEGHAALIRTAKTRSEPVIVSLFVNPTQFNDTDDFKKYPRTEERDLALLRELDVDAVFIPSAHEMYPGGVSYFVDENKESLELCGKFRPGHFRGMLTVVLKLFQIVAPTRAYFGEKDYQQLTLVQGLVQEFHCPVEIVPVATVREADGLAMSSRNVRLSAEDREKAPAIFKILSIASTAAEADARLRALGFQVEYVEERWGRRLAAVNLNGVRLIDNVPL